MLHAPDALFLRLLVVPRRELFAYGADVGPLAAAGELFCFKAGGAEGLEFRGGDDGFDDDETVALEIG